MTLLLLHLLACKGAASGDSVSIEDFAGTWDADVDEFNDDRTGVDVYGEGTTVSLTITQSFGITLTLTTPSFINESNGDAAANGDGSYRMTTTLMDVNCALAEETLECSDSGLTDWPSSGNDTWVVFLSMSRAGG